MFPELNIDGYTMAQIPRILGAGLSPEDRVHMWVSVTSLEAQPHSEYSGTQVGAGLAGYCLL